MEAQLIERVHAEYSLVQSDVLVQVEALIDELLPAETSQVAENVKDSFRQRGVEHTFETFRSASISQMIGCIIVFIGPPESGHLQLKTSADEHIPSTRFGQLMTLLYHAYICERAYTHSRKTRNERGAQKELKRLAVSICENLVQSCGASDLREVYDRLLDVKPPFYIQDLFRQRRRYPRVESAQGAFVGMEP